MRRYYFTILILFSVYHLGAQKINGVSIVGPFIDTTSQAIQEIDELGANWISLNPEAVFDRQTMEVLLNEDNLFWSHKLEGYRGIIKKAKSLNQKVLLKPHLVVGKNYQADDRIKSEVTWRGEIMPIYFWDWTDIQENYRAYILSMARFAEETQVDMFCIGTELKSFVEKRPGFWSSLIKEIRTIYSGDLIYSANWDNYQHIPFWDQLDYIGVNGYFPISDQALPDVAQTSMNWNPIVEQLNSLSKRVGKRVIITEFGYRNVSYAGLEPWTHDVQGKFRPENEVQYNLMQSFFERVWPESWLAGGFLWNWNYNVLSEGNTDFSVQGKEAEELVREVYGGQ